MPAYFPNLNSGATAQYPIRRTTRYRTVVNANDLTTTIRASDPGARRIAWWLRYQGLADNEVAALTGLFQEVKGPLGSFTFVDPEANLLTQSENLTHVFWQKSAGLGMVSAATAPDSASQSFRLIASPGQPAEISQTLPVPASYRWVLSAYLRADQPTDASLFLRSSLGEHSKTVNVGAQWQRYSFGGQFWNSTDGMDAGLRIGGGAVIEATAFQLECQATPSRYQRTETNRGIYPNARFSQDSLHVTTLAANCHQLSLIITAPLPD